ncbi:flippase-like domain-containing protein [bacterium]|nr:MAG: flippase-like domain-containing protein [bacterium]
MTPSKSSNKAVLKWSLRLLSGVFVVALLLLQRGTVERLLQTLSNTPFWVFGAAVAFYLLGQALCAWKWQLLLRARGFNFSLWRCCSIYLSGMFANLWLPTNIGGDALRVSQLARDSQIGTSDAFASVLIDRLTGFAALILLAFVGLLSSGAARGQWPLVAISLVLLCVVTGALFLLPRVKHPKVKRVGEAITAYAKHRTDLAIALLLSLIFQVSQVALNFGLARALGLPVSPLEMGWIGPLLSLSGLLPLGIGGLGTREVAAVALLGRFGVERGEAVAWSLLWQATVWGASLPGLFFLKGGHDASVDRTS